MLSGLKDPEGRGQKWRAEKDAAYASPALNRSFSWDTSGLSLHVQLVIHAHVCVQADTNSLPQDAEQVVI